MLRLSPTRKLNLDLEVIDVPPLRSRKRVVKRVQRVQTQLDFNVRKLSTLADKQIVVGEVYTPYILDSHGEMMLPEDIELMAHRFLIDNKNGMIDIMHNNKVIHASVVESYIAKVNDADGYAPGTWVAAVKIFDEVIWAKAQSGELNGFSIEAWVYKVAAEVEYDYLPIHYGFVEKNDGHDHAFYVEVDTIGRVTRGFTSVDDGHTHEIKGGTATEASKDENGLAHAHRYFLNELE